MPAAAAPESLRIDLLHVSRGAIGAALGETGHLARLEPGADNGISTAVFCIGHEATYSVIAGRVELLLLFSYPR